jgi:hypothetical protein
MPNINAVLANGKFVLLQVYRLSAVSVKCKIVTNVHLEDIQNSGRKAPLMSRFTSLSLDLGGKEVLVPLEYEAGWGAAPVWSL